MSSILIIDDDEGMRETLADILEEVGYETSITDTGKGALHMLKDTKFDIVIIDIRLPDMSGTDLLKEIKALNPDSECIMVTGLSDVKSTEESMREGAYAYMIKPLDIDKVLKTIKDALSE